MRSRLRWLFAGITALVVGYVLFRRSESKRTAEETRRYLEQEGKLRAIAATMKQEGDTPGSPPPLDQSNNRPARTG